MTTGPGVIIATATASTNCLSGEAKEELLVTREPVLDGSGPAREGRAVRIVGSGNAAEIGDVFIQRLLAIHGKVGKRFVSVVLRGESGGGRLEMRQVSGFPPIAHTTGGIECTAGRVKDMADFVPDHSADGAVIHRRGSLRIEVRRLEMRSGKVERVLQRQFAGIDGLRVQAGPLSSIDGMAETGDKAVVIKLATAPEVSENVIRLDFVGGVVPPGLRVTDSHIEIGELGLGFRFGRSIHPGESINAAPVSGDDVRNHRFNLGLSFG